MPVVSRQCRRPDSRRGAWPRGRSGRTQVFEYPGLPSNNSRRSTRRSPPLAPSRGRHLFQRVGAGVGQDDPSRGRRRGELRPANHGREVSDQFLH